MCTKIDVIRLIWIIVQSGAKRSIFRDVLVETCDRIPDSASRCVFNDVFVIFLCDLLSVIRN